MNIIIKLLIILWIYILYVYMNNELKYKYLKNMCRFNEKVERYDIINLVKWLFFMCKCWMFVVKGEFIIDGGIFFKLL